MRSVSDPCDQLILILVCGIRNYSDSFLRYVYDLGRNSVECLAGSIYNDE